MAQVSVLCVACASSSARSRKTVSPTARAIVTLIFDFFFRPTLGWFGPYIHTRATNSGPPWVAVAPPSRSHHKGVPLMSASAAAPGLPAAAQAFIGVFKGRGKGCFPTMPDFEYDEELSFSALGAKPILAMQQRTFKPSTQQGMHFER